jgi:hypothetical protein
MNTYTCTRVYNNGDRVTVIRIGEAALEWLEYNKTWRFGNALFVNGICEYPGYLDKERIKAIEQELQQPNSKRIGNHNQWLLTVE